MKTLSKMILAAAITTGLLVGTTMAQADEWHDHEVHAHDWHEKHRHHHHDHGPVIVQEPNIVYAPPVVVEAPQPEEESGINLVFPINIH